MNNNTQFDGLGLLTTVIDGNHSRSRSATTQHTQINYDGSSPDSNLAYTPIESIGSFTSYEENADSAAEGKDTILDDDEGLQRQIVNLLGSTSNSYSDEALGNINTDTHDRPEDLDSMEVDGDLDELEKVILDARDEEIAFEARSDQQYTGLLDLGTEDVQITATPSNYNMPHQNNNSNQYKVQSSVTHNVPAIEAQVQASSQAPSQAQTQEQIPPPPPPQENKFLKCFAMLKTNYLNLCSAYNTLIVKFNDSEVERVRLQAENGDLKCLLDASLHELNHLRAINRQK
ncbi:hypothetical protein CANARDRAFT_22621 [[Candida] arabinofermentans NRRL YB-2248]|uniref:Uncharacterized protein n=1 Tax=[Candida] arabinofermentans NRRL YB-2248 TaxID=983967 RepID=A0A1E4T285_9ASCO|nr:hypothetical protein CANARDRAFT_22621 [[Candida] arabinofermentans NRRL YB-2248]